MANLYTLLHNSKKQGNASKVVANFVLAALALRYTIEVSSRLSHIAIFLSCTPQGQRGPRHMGEGPVPQVQRAFGIQAGSQRLRAKNNPSAPPSIPRRLPYVTFADEGSDGEVDSTALASNRKFSPGAFICTLNESVVDVEAPRSRSTCAHHSYRTPHLECGGSTRIKPRIGIGSNEKPVR